MKAGAMVAMAVLAALLLEVQAQNCTGWYDTVKHGKWFRNAKDYGAKGDGVTDDTAALMAALTSGRQDVRSLEQQLVVYLPPGTYIVSNTLRIYFYTMFVGSEVCPSVIKMAANQSPKNVRKYIVEGPLSCDNCQHTDDFYYQLNNIVLDYTNPGNEGGCALHWAVSQGSTLRNITIELGDADLGIFGENGSGGWMSDILISGGRIGMYFGNQQWVFRNIVLRNQRFAGVQLLWNWVFTFVGLTIQNTQVGFQFETAGGALVLADSVFDNVGTAIWTDYNFPQGHRTLVLSRVSMNAVTNLTACYMTPRNVCSSDPVPAQNWYKLWREGYDLSDMSGPIRGSVEPILPNTSLPVQDFPVYTSVFNVFDAGAKGDGQTDDTAALQKAVNENRYVFLPYGTYLISGTVTLKSDTHLIGEAMTEIRAHGFGSGAMLLVPDEPTGTTTLSKLIFTTDADSPGATLLQWGAGKGAIFDCHFRLYHTVGEMLHVTPSGGGYIENMWGWVADHDINTGSQITVMNKKGFRAESQQPLTLLAVAFEHSADHQFLFDGAKDVTMVVPQTESAYWQKPPSGFGCRVKDVQNFSLFGGGFYNWFNGVQDVLFEITNTTGVTLLVPNVNSPDPQLTGGGGATLLKTSTLTVPTSVPFNNSGFCSHFAVYINQTVP